MLDGAIAVLVPLGLACLLVGVLSVRGGWEDLVHNAGRHIRQPASSVPGDRQSGEGQPDKGQPLPLLGSTACIPHRSHRQGSDPQPT